MRNRTELVTTTVADSENEESEANDSGEDWQPEKVQFFLLLLFFSNSIFESKKQQNESKFLFLQQNPAGARKSVGRKSVSKTPLKRKSTTRASNSAKKGKKDDSDEEPDDDEDDEENENDDDDEDENDDDEDGEEASGKSRRRAISGKNHPDKDGFMELYLFKNDLTKDYRTDEKLCLWRRDGASLLQKYLVELEDGDADGSLIFKQSSVYSCWEEKRKSDFFTIKVKVVGDKRDGKVRVVDIDELHGFATDETRQPVDTTPNGADPNIESILSTDDEDDEEGEGEGDGDEDEDEDEDEE